MGMYRRLFQGPPLAPVACSRSRASGPVLRPHVPSAQLQGGARGGDAVGREELGEK